MAHIVLARVYANPLIETGVVWWDVYAEEKFYYSNEGKFDLIFLFEIHMFHTLRFLHFTL
jgi:hypothetical protein